MSIEVFGLAISDIAAIAALISSALIFYFGYSQTRKSEQGKIAREILVKIEIESNKVFAELGGPIEKVENIKVEEITFTLNSIWTEVCYFKYLLQTRVLRDNHTLKCTNTDVMAGLVNRIIDMNSNEPTNEKLYSPLKYLSKNLSDITRYFANQMKKYKLC